MLNLSNKRDLLNMTYDEVKEWIALLEEKSYRAGQIFEALHKNCVSQIDAIATLPIILRQKLRAQAQISTLTISQTKLSEDGTRKYQFKTMDGAVIESVFIPNAATQGRNTICISSQVGCAMGCTFCATAALGLTRNLSAAEIVAQVYSVERDLRSIGFTNTKPSKVEAFIDDRFIHNIVFMGMGEPLHNYDNVVRAITLLTDAKGQNYSARRITVSTSGIVKNIERLSHDTKVQIAISLNATNDLTRTKIMPVNQKWPIQELLSACSNYRLHSRRRITFEYVLLDQINDSDENARALVQLLRHFRCKVNLIPFNPHPLSPYKRPSRQRTLAFQKILLDSQMTAFIRTTRGDDIDAACGMLGAEPLAQARIAAINPFSN